MKQFILILMMITFNAGLSNANDSCNCKKYLYKKPKTASPLNNHKYFTTKEYFLAVSNPILIKIVLTHDSIDKIGFYIQISTSSGINTLYQGQEILIVFEDSSTYLIKVPAEIQYSHYEGPGGAFSDNTCYFYIPLTKELENKMTSIMMTKIWVSHKNNIPRKNDTELGILGRDMTRIKNLFCCFRSKHE